MPERDALFKSNPGLCVVVYRVLTDRSRARVIAIRRINLAAQLSWRNFPTLH